MYFLKAAKPILIDLASTFIFLAVYQATHSLKASILVGIAAGILQVLWSLLRRQSVAPMQWASLGLVVVLGGASLLTRDPRFVMFKPTLVDAVLAAVMAQRGWLTRYLPAVVTGNVEPAVIKAWGRAWPGLMIVLGLANIAVALGLGFDFWVWYSSIAPMACVILLFLAQYFTFRRLIVAKIRAERAPSGAPEA